MALKLAQYNLASAGSYAPSAAVVAKLVEHASSPEFQQRIAKAHAEQALNCRRFRALLGSNVVRALDKWL